MVASTTAGGGRRPSVCQARHPRTAQAGIPVISGFSFSTRFLSIDRLARLGRIRLLEPDAERDESWSAPLILGLCSVASQSLNSGEKSNHPWVRAEQVRDPRRRPS